MARLTFLFRKRKSNRLSARLSRGRLNRRPVRPLLESLERRDLLASYTTPEDKPLVVSDPALVHAVVIAGPAHGTVAFSDAGGFTYKPAENFNGQDAFVYGFANSASGTTLTGNETAAITVQSVNDPPSGTDMVRQVPANAAYTIQTSDFGFRDENDNPQNAFLAVQILTLPTSGKLVDGNTPVAAGTTIPIIDVAQGLLKYIPDATNTTATTAVSFTFAVQDDGGRENGGVDTDPSPNKLTIGVAPIVQPPKLTANPDTYGVVQGGTLTIAAPGVLGNDTKTGDGIVSGSRAAQLKDGAGHGGLTLNADGSFTYKPAADFIGTDTFTYYDTATYVPPSTNGAVSDPIVIVSNTTTVTINVRSNAPIVYANNDTYFAMQNTLLGIAAPGVLKNDVVYSADATNTTPGTTAILNLPLNATLVTDASHGTLQLAADGSFNYTPAKDFYGADTFTYRATIATTGDGPTFASNPLSHDVATVTIYVKPSPPAVVANNDTFATTMNVALDIAAPGVLKNDYVILGDPTTGTGGTTNTSPLPSYPLIAALVSKPANGSVELHSDGSFHYVPNDNFAGSDTFTYQASLNPSATADANNPPQAIATVTIKVNPVIQRPVAVDDSYWTPAGTQLKIDAPGVLGNDKKPDGSHLAAILGATTSHGNLEFHSDGSFSYMPASGYTGPDTFTYQAVVFLDNPAPPSGDPNQYISDAATVTINVKPIVTHPVVVASNDSFDDLAGKPLDISPPGVLKNDYVLFVDPATGTATNADGAANNILPPSYPLSAVLMSQPANGTVELHSDGSLHYVPKDGFVGADTFTYRAVLATTDPPQTTASDTTIATHDVATVTINVKPIIPRPVAVDDSYSTPAGTQLKIDAPGVLGNDKKPDGSHLAALLGATTAHGNLEFHADGSFSYTPETGFAGPDTFTYQAVVFLDNPSPPAGDPNQYISDLATVTIFVKRPEPPPGPVAVNDFYLTAENTPLGIGMPGVLANDYFRLAVPPPGAVDPATGTSNGAIPVKIPLTAILVDGPSNGVLSLNADGSFKYMPNTDFVGTDTFTYQDTVALPTADGSTATANFAPVLSNIATVTIRVVPAVAHNDSYATDVNTALDVTAPGVLGNDSGGSADHPLMATLLAGPMHGTLKLGEDGSFHYEPAVGYVGADIFSYRASDGTTTNPPTIDPTTGVALATTISGEPNRPINAYDIGIVKIYVRPAGPHIEAHNDKYLTPENTALTIDAPGVLANDYGPVNVPVIASLVDKPTHGTVTLGAQGDFTYTPDADFVGEDKFTYSASVVAATGSTTSAIKSGLATVVIYVAAPNETPSVILGGDQITTDESGPQKIVDYAASLVVDSNGAPPAITVNTDQPNLFSTPPSIDPAGQLVYTPAPNASGTATITVTTIDPATGGDGETATFTIHIDKPHAFTNTADPCDVTDDSTVAADDVLSVINYINAHGSSEVSQVPTDLIKHLFYDVDKDNWIVAIDVLTIINYINAHPDQSAPATDGDIDASLLTLVAQDTADATLGKKRT